ncbi:MAG TPA: DUF748 domain-containing protein [Verrucomicrobiae bacterium]|nr:DUF748 domain-containing protein [Verrucomicrobiae bacterium]
MKDTLNIRSKWRRLSRTMQWIVVVVIVLIIVRIALPYGIKAYVNHKLNEAHDYTGKIGDVTMKLWRGGYRIHQIGILKRDGTVQSPLFSASELDLTIDWRELLHGSVVGEVVMTQPHINFVMGPTPEQTQSGKDESWDKMLESLFPFNLNRVEIDKGEIHFQNQYSKPPVDIYLKELAATATNLTNARELNQKLPSGLTASGSTIGGGNLNLQLQMNLLKEKPTYEISCGLTNVDLVALNDFLRAYGKFDVAHGNFAIYTSVASAEGSYEGYFKVFFNNLDVFEWEKERKKNILEVFWQAIVGGVATALKNHPKDQLATKVPISGSYSNSTVGVWTATGTLLQNAFIHALVPKIDQHVTVEQVEKTDNKPEANKADDKK